MWRLILLVCIACSGSQVDRVAKYLKQYWGLRKNIRDKSQLADSIASLNKKFGWNLDSVKTIIASWQDVNKFDKLFDQLEEEK